MLGDLFVRKWIKDFWGTSLSSIPRAYEDQRKARNISSLKPDDIVSIKFSSCGSLHSINMGRSTRKCTMS